MGAAIVACVVISILLIVSFLLVTKMAYSRKWENDHDETRGQF